MPARACAQLRGNIGCNCGLVAAFELNKLHSVISCLQVCYNLLNIAI